MVLRTQRDREIKDGDEKETAEREREKERVAGSKLWKNKDLRV